MKFRKPNSMRPILIVVPELLQFLLFKDDRYPLTASDGGTCRGFQQLVDAVAVTSTAVSLIFGADQGSIRFRIVGKTLNRGGSSGVFTDALPNPEETVKLKKGDYSKIMLKVLI